MGSLADEPKPEVFHPSTSFTREDGTPVPAFVHGPPGLIVIQEWWGITEQVKKQARDFGATGFRTLVPDLYRGELGVNAEEAHHLMDNLDWQGAVADIAAAAKYLKDTGCPTVAVMGFCMGGALSLAAGVHSADIDKVVCFYGTPPDALADVTTISKPVQAHFGDEDSHAGFSDPAAVAALREKLEVSGADF